MPLILFGNFIELLILKMVLPIIFLVLDLTGFRNLSHLKFPKNQKYGLHIRDNVQCIDNALHINKTTILSPVLQGGGTI